ncbi:peptidoglycan-binding domain-containing protein [Nocardiopsis sp. CT-R113]|uniref:Peptidoglycan-binding domain-containing protein n=1 Tax=Nocardiopsis codii TaxID=3065942 RepID=A0ABU7KFL9_9ACTN|nr:peptidoglycan-binding domain-containing protein [Nocardiopsis sp. CT-R113]MEE2041034.1 peptidoglycan-binding domain-containing protein [Nocardiopsis sp. CT-R113]
MIGLREGDSGERVKFLQELLVAAGFPVGTSGIDGFYGPSTSRAVLACRRSEGSNATSGTSITGAAGKQILSSFIKSVMR